MERTYTNYTRITFRNTTNGGELCTVVSNQTTNHCVLLDRLYWLMSQVYRYLLYFVNMYCYVEFISLWTYLQGLLLQLLECKYEYQTVLTFPSRMADCNATVYHCSISIMPGIMYQVPYSLRVSRPPTCCAPRLLLGGAEPGRGKWRRHVVAWTRFRTERILAWLRLPMGVRGAGWWRRPSTLRFRCSSCLGRITGE